MKYKEKLSEEKPREKTNKKLDNNLKTYSNINEAIYDYAISIKNNFISNINIKTNDIIEHLEIFKNLDQIIENGKLIAKADENKGRYKYSNWKYYATPIIINNKKYIVEFDTTLRNDGQRHFRLIRLYSIKEVIKKTSYSDRGF